MSDHEGLNGDSVFLYSIFLGNLFYNSFYLLPIILYSIYSSTSSFSFLYVWLFFVFFIFLSIISFYKPPFTPSCIMEDDKHFSIHTTRCHFHLTYKSHIVITGPLFPPGHRTYIIYIT